VNWEGKVVPVQLTIAVALLGYDIVLPFKSKQIVLAVLENCVALQGAAAPETIPPEDCAARELQDATAQ